MKELNVLIVDDEAPAIERLARLIEAEHGARVCGQVSDATAVEGACKTARPDVVLLDVEMPGLDGIELARRLRLLEPSPALIFVTAYENYAVEAFELAAVDYLVKPVRSERLSRALKRARSRPPGSNQMLRTRLGDRLLSIPLAEIRALIAEDKYTVVHFNEGEALIDDSLVSLEQRFPRHFIRVHRKALVARRYVRGLVRDSRGQERVDLDGCELRPPVSRRRLAQVRKTFESV